MKDETYVFIQESKEKKAIARSSHNRRSHAGKGGKVRFPHDNLTKKELKAMNGEIKTYKMNEPMTWEDFKSMPDDHKIAYIKRLREKSGVPDKEIAEMMGVDRQTVGRWFRCLGLGLGKCSGSRRQWKQDVWNVWIGKVEEVAEAEKEPVETAEATVEEFIENESVAEPEPLPIIPIKTKAIPESGTMLFNGKAGEILASISDLLGDANVCINITWDVLPEESVTNG